jgi:hypothetical protein
VAGKGATGRDANGPELRFGSVHGSTGTGKHDSSVVAKFTSSANGVPPTAPDAISCRTSFALSGQGSPFARRQLGCGSSWFASIASSAAL